MITKYKQWNTALWNYFFPSGNENPILYIDYNLLKEIGEKSGIKCSGSWEEDFLGKVLLPKNAFKGFWKLWHDEKGTTCKVNTWDDFVKLLENEKFNGIPAYFAILCAIMYLACSVEGLVTHDKIQKEALKYLGEEYRGNRLGELVDEMFAFLYEDQPSFNPDRMVCGNQRNMSRIKFHLVLKPNEKDDFIDFLEVGNYQWHEGSYADFANNILIPALHKADKPDRYFEIVKKPELIPYVKNILQSELNWGKDPSESVYHNSRQIIDIQWKYVIELDYNASPTFYISSDNLPFGVKLSDNTFMKSDIMSDYIASDVSFVELPMSSELLHEGYSYILHNVAQNEAGDWPIEIYFQEVGEDYYRQVETPIEGLRYIKLLNDRTHNIDRYVVGWTESEIRVENYRVYETASYSVPQRTVRRRNTDKVQDVYELYGVGTWFGARLQEGQHVFWESVTVDSSKEEIPVIHAPNGKAYFRLPRNNKNFLRGNLTISEGENKIELLSEQIVDDFHWNGHHTIYGYNEWGEAIEGNRITSIEANTTGNYIFSGAKEASNSNMLIQILNDIADENGCVSRKKMVDALNFVMDFNKIVPTNKNINTLIFSLRRLGLIVSYYNGKEYVNQLVGPYIEKTNYAIGQRNNAYLIRGVYDTILLGKLVKKIKESHGAIKYKRPYSLESLNKYPEYICLPDMILFVIDKINEIADKWKIINHPVAFDMINSMAFINDFSQHFLQNDNGDLYVSQNDLDTPCMVFNNDKEVLCTRDIRNNYKIFQRYFDENGITRPIPKHLSRTYCRVQRHKPLCILYKDVDGDTSYSRISFVNKCMGRPGLLEVALCDLNLGIPSYEEVFIVNADTFDLARNDEPLYSSCVTYSTGANDAHEDNKKLLKMVLDKIGVSNDTTSILYSKSRYQGMRLKLIKFPNHKKSLLLFDRYLNEQYNHIYAFSDESAVYVWNEAIKAYKEVEGNSVNQKLSDVINNRARTKERYYTQPIPKYVESESKEIKIIRRF